MKGQNMFKKTLLCLSVASALVVASGVVSAASASTSVPVSASVSQSCTISTTAALAFAGYDPIGTNAAAALNATGQISVACAKGAKGLTIGMDNGTHFAASQRQMQGASAASLLKYDIFQPPNNTPNSVCTFPGTTAWTNSGNGLFSLSSATTMAVRVYNVCGSIPGGQDVSADSYTDTVSATINF
jgi:spore coat protein U-like protein